MAKDLHLKVIIDQAGNAGAGISALSSGLSGLAGIGGGAALAGIGALTGVVVGLGAAAISAWSDFDAGQDTILSMTGITGAALDEMSDAMLRLSESSAGVGHGMEGIGATIAAVTQRTGATGDQLEEVTEQFLELSRVTGIDAVAGVESITRVMGDWGVTLNDQDDLLDKLLVASQKSGIGVDALADKMVQFGAPLRAMGFGMDESIALFAKWEKEGVNAELVMGSLRIAAGHFADAQKGANEQMVGGVKSMKDAETKLFTLKNQLSLATLKQSEWTETTKESTKVQSAMKIDTLTGQISELEAAMALGEERMVTTAGATKSLKDSLMETFDSIKNAPTQTEALGLAMEVFGARAGPDMAAAIREGRFAIEDMVALIGDSKGALDEAADATLDFGDRFGLIKQKVMNSLIPTGQIIMDLADRALPALESAAGIVADFFENTFAPGAQAVIDAFDEGGLAGVWDLVATKWDAALPVLEAKVGLWLNSLHTMVVQNIPFIGELENAFNDSGLAGIFDLLSQKWADAAPILQARLFLMTNSIKTSIAQNWPGIEAALSLWGTNFWNWLDKAAIETDMKFKELVRSIETWVNSHQAEIENAGQLIAEAVFDGLSIGFTDPKNSDTAMQSFVSSLGASVSRFGASMFTIAGGLAEGFIKGIVGKWTGTEPSSRLTQAIKDMLVRAAAGFNPLILFTPVGRASIDGMIKGFSNGLEALKRAAVNAAKAAFNAAMSFLGAHSPSQLFSDQVGEMAIGGGIAQGIGRAAGAIKSSTQGALGGVAGAAFGPALTTPPPGRRRPSSRRPDHPIHLRPGYFPGRPLRGGAEACAVHCRGGAGRAGGERALILDFRF